MLYEPHLFTRFFFIYWHCNIYLVLLFFFSFSYNIQWNAEHMCIYSHTFIIWYDSYWKIRLSFTNKATNLEYYNKSGERYFRILHVECAGAVINCCYILLNVLKSFLCCVLNTKIVNKSLLPCPIYSLRQMLEFKFDIKFKAKVNVNTFMIRSSWFAVMSRLTWVISWFMIHGSWR